MMLAEGGWQSRSGFISLLLSCTPSEVNSLRIAACRLSMPITFRWRTFLLIIGKDVSLRSRCFRPVPMEHRNRCCIMRVSALPEG